MKNLFRVPFAILMASVLLVSCSKDSVSEFDDASNSVNNYEQNLQTNAIPWPVVLVAIKIISDVTDGRYSQVTKYEDGEIKSQVTTCKGLLGTCSISSNRTTNGAVENVSLEPVRIDESDSDSYSTHAELQNTDQGILYAINYQEYLEDAERFFATDLKTISGELIIDNPIILEELSVDSSEPIIVSGEYEVFQSDNYKYIVIDEK